MSRPSDLRFTAEIGCATCPNRRTIKGDTWAIAALTGVDTSSTPITTIETYSLPYVLNAVSNGIIEMSTMQWHSEVWAGPDCDTDGSSCPFSELIGEVATNLRVNVENAEKQQTQRDLDI